MSLDTADINGDGTTDILVTDAAANSLLVFTGSASGTFSRTDASLIAFGTTPWSVTAADFLLGDGEDDVAVGLFNSDLVPTSLVTNTANVWAIFRAMVSPFRGLA